MITTVKKSDIFGVFFNILIARSYLCTPSEIDEIAQLMLLNNFKLMTAKKYGLVKRNFKKADYLGKTHWKDLEVGMQ